MKKRIVFSLLSIIVIGLIIAGTFLESIVKKANIRYENGSVIFAFKEDISYDIASKFGYNSILSEALSDYFGKNINAVLKLDKSEKEIKDENIDPLDSLMKIADEIAIIANGTVKKKGAVDEVFPLLMEEFNNVCNFR